MAHAGGRPPKYKNVEEIEEKIEQYFAICEGEPLLDDEGNPVVNKYGYPCWIKPPKPPTVTGLALALGFTTRLSLLNYQGKKEFMNTITRAKSKIEEYAESRLFDRDGSNGAQFSLRNNFKGWNIDNEQKLEIELLKLESPVKDMGEIINPKCPYCNKEFEIQNALYNPLSELYGEYRKETAGVVCPYCNEKYYISKQIRYISRKK